METEDDPETEPEHSRGLRKMRNKSDNRDVLLSKLYRRLILVQILSMITGTLGTLIDGIVISNALGPEAMAAMGLAMPLSLIAVALSIAFGSGFSSVSGKLMGQGKFEEVSGKLSITFFSSLAAGCLIAAILFFCPEGLVSLLNVEGELFEFTVQYLKGYAPSAIFILLTPTLVCCMQLDNDGKRSILSTGLLLVFDITGDLMAGYVLHAGMFGMGLVTSIAYFVSIVVLLLHFAGKKHSLRIRLQKFSFRTIGRIFVTGVPSSLASLCNAFQNIILNYLLIAIGGGLALTAFSSLNTLIPPVTSIINGAGATSVLVISMIFGEENRRYLHHTFGKIQGFDLIVSTATALVIIIFARPLAAVFAGTGGPEVMDLLVKIFRLFAACIPLLMINKLFVGFYQSTGKLVLAVIISVLDNIVYIVTIAAILSVRYGADGVWISYLLGELATTLTLSVIIIIKRKKFPVTLYDFLLIPDGFGVTHENRLNLTATNMEEAVGISERIIEFCRQKGIDQHRAKGAGLCMEELALYAFSETNRKKPVYVDMYIITKDDKVKMRLRYNGRLMDPMKREEGEDDQDNMGIRIVQGMCSEINYSIAFSYNIINITI